MSRWYVSDSAPRPNNLAERWTVGVAESKIRTLRANGHIVKIARLALVKEVFDNPLGIVGGWSRPDQDDCFVYFGKPQRDFRSATITVPVPPDMFFLVFVLPDGTIDNWGWRKADDDNPDIPADLIRHEGASGSGQRGELLWMRPK